MARTTVKAMKDPRATSPARVPPGAWPAAVPALRPQEAETLVAVIRTLCPHDWLADATYRDAAFALVNDAVADPHATITLREGLRALAADGFASRPEAQRVAKLANRAETPFFRMSLRRCRPLSLRLARGVGGLRL